MIDSVKIVKDNFRRPRAEVAPIEHYGKLPPQVKELEEAVLGAIMIENHAMPEVIRILKNADCFYVDAHQRIYSAMIELWLEESPIDLLTVTQQLRTRGDLDAAGGPFYVAQLTNKVGSAAHVETHAYIVKEQWIKRESITVATQVIRDAYEDTTDCHEVLGNAIASLNNVLNEVISTGEETFSDLVDDFDEYLLSDIEKMGLTTGYGPLNRKTMGFEGGDLILISGRPSEGKTTLMLQGACAVARLGKPIAIFSLEMSKRKLLQKIYAMEAGIDLEHLRNGKLSAEEWARYKIAKEVVRKWKIYICDTSGISVEEACSYVISWHAKYKIECAYFDFIQLMSAAQGERRVGTREQEVGTISRKLKGVAGKIGIPVVALSSMSRSIEDKRSKARRPDNSDLRDSGSLESDADLIIFVYRPEMHGIDKLEDGTSTKDLTEFIVTKQRMGKRGPLKAKFEGKYSRFVEEGLDFSERIINNVDYSGPTDADFNGQGDNKGGDDDLPF